MVKLEDLIGKRAFRQSAVNGKPISHAHRIESVVNGRLVTYCGRQPKAKNAQGRYVQVGAFDSIIECADCPMEEPTTNA